MKLLTILLSALLMASCATTAPSPTVIGYATSQTLMDAAAEVDRAEKRGWITPAEESEMLDNLIAGQQLLGSLLVVGEVPGCTELQTDQECLQQVLLNIEDKLRESQK